MSVKTKDTFWSIFNGNGDLLADSKIASNKLVLKGKRNIIGCPSPNDEVTTFVYKLKL